MLATGDVPVSYGTLADGFQGTDQTVALMGRMAMGRYGAASPKIRALALNILESRRVPEKDYDAEARAIGEWVRDTITYRRDVHGQETLSHPEETAFNTHAGDCLDGDTLLLTPSGLRPIRDVKPGDVIAGKKGWTRVTNWWDKGNLVTSEFFLNSGGSFVCTAEHRCFRASGEEALAGALRKHDCLLGAPSLIPTGEGAFTAAECYFVGMFLADGWSDGNRVCVSGKDGFAKEAQKIWIRDWAAAQGWATSWHPRYIRVYIPKEHRLHALLLGTETAAFKEVPEEIWKDLTEESAKSLLAGLLVDSHDPKQTKRRLDAVETRKPRKGNGGLTYSTVSPRLADQVRVLFRYQGIGCRITRVVNHGGLGLNPVYRVYPRLHRPKIIQIEDIESAGIRHVFDIETEDHGIYLPQADVVVHNCDDKSILLAALLGAVGIPTRFKVIGVTPHQYSHVYLQARPRNTWITMDPIMKDKPIGWEVPATKRAIEKTYAINLPAGGSMNGLNGLGMMSPLEAAPPPMAAKPAYVSMPSNLDTDADITPLMYYKPNQNVPAQYPQQRADWRGPQLQYLTNQGLRNQPVLRPDAPLPPRPADEGRFEVLTPDRMQGVGVDLDQAQPAQAYPNMRPVLTKPEGVDLQFVRAAQVFDPNQDDKIAFQGTPDLQQRPPIKPLTNLQGMGSMDPSMLPGMGVVYGAGPGLAAGATGNEVPEYQGETITVTASAPNYGRLLMIGAAVVGGIYLLKRRKRARR